MEHDYNWPCLRITRNLHSRLESSQGVDTVTETGGNLHKKKQIQCENRSVTWIQTASTSKQKLQPILTKGAAFNEETVSESVGGLYETHKQIVVHESGLLTHTRRVSRNKSFTQPLQPRSFQKSSGALQCSLCAAQPLITRTARARLCIGQSIKAATRDASEIWVLAFVTAPICSGQERARVCFDCLVLYSWIDTSLRA